MTYYKFVGSDAYLAAPPLVRIGEALEHLVDGFQDRDQAQGHCGVFGVSHAEV